MVQLFQLVSFKNVRGLTKKHRNIFGIVKLSTFLHFNNFEIVFLSWLKGIFEPIFSSYFLLKLLLSLHYANIVFRDVLLHWELIVIVGTDLLLTFKKGCNYGCFTRMVRLILKLRGLRISCLFNIFVRKPQTSQLNGKQINSAFR